MLQLDFDNLKGLPPELRVAELRALIAKLRKEDVKTVDVRRALLQAQIMLVEAVRESRVLERAHAQRAAVQAQRPEEIAEKKEGQKEKTLEDQLKDVPTRKPETPAGAIKRQIDTPYSGRTEDAYKGHAYETERRDGYARADQEPKERAYTQSERLEQQFKNPWQSEAERFMQGKEQGSSEQRGYARKKDEHGYQR